MTAEAAFREFQAFMRKATHANIMIAADDKDSEDELVFQRLTLSESLSDEFLQDMLSEFAEEDEEIVLRKYDPGYKPGDEELCYVSLNEVELVRDVVDSVSEFGELELFKEADDVINGLRFYAVIVENRSEKAVFFRSFSPKKELTRSGHIAIVHRGDVYDRIKQKIFLFDKEADCLAWAGYMFIKSTPAFQRIFRYFEALAKRADETIDSVSARVPISNLDELRTACKAHPLMLAKLAQIARRPYIKKLSMRDIKRTITEVGLPVKTVKEGGVEKLVFEPSPAKRWMILKLLDDDYLRSIMTEWKYDANSKVAI